MKTVKNALASFTLICVLAVGAAAQDPGTILSGGDKTQPPTPPPPATQPASTDATTPDEDESLWDDILDWWYGDDTESTQ